jgi:hypothetical protein
MRRHTGHMRAAATWRAHSARMLQFAAETRDSARTGLAMVRLSPAPTVWSDAVASMVADWHRAMCEARRYRRMAQQGGLRLP